VGLRRSRARVGHEAIRQRDRLLEAWDELLGRERVFVLRNILAGRPA
jgi:hypothetical protein